MSTNISSIADRIDRACHSKKCKSGKCIVDLTNLPSPPNRLIVDMDCKELNTPSDGKRCDYIIFLDFSNHNESIVIVPIEMKSGRVHGVKGIIEQIEGGIKFVQNWIGNNIPHTITPVLVHNGIHPNNCRKLKETTIRINNHKKSKLILMECGERLIHRLSRI